MGLQKNFQKFLQSAQDPLSQEQLNNQIYLIRFSHTKALLLKKNRHKTDIFPVLQNLTHMAISTQVAEMQL